ncbi:hypothetical protein LMH87_002463 [Akanthomyces muscarius]|uniref:Uncharacterized protein n=1 Tax=Akanthomyces muscarius TaxID=2231603 RepID=A0A9W8Q747_AKAMU|nr:hypothetical protein LMH87_002463 [Akanthomyces muscarius]KAJ4147972.1 hypothetical protein LMH87_002463 [Akanthomyces muscarius]
MRLKEQNSSEISLFLDDAARILQTHLQTIILAPLQLYSSLLIFTRQKSKVKAFFDESRDKANWICLGPQIQNN